MLYADIVYSDYGVVYRYIVQWLVKLHTDIVYGDYGVVYRYSVQRLVSTDIVNSDLYRHSVQWQGIFLQMLCTVISESFTDKVCCDERAKWYKQSICKM